MKILNDEIKEKIDFENLTVVWQMQMKNDLLDIEDIDIKKIFLNLLSQNENFKDWYDDIDDDLKVKEYSLSLGEIEDIEETYLYYHNGIYYLLPEDEIYKCNDIAVCNDCGTLIHINDGTYLDNYDCVVCSDCLDDNYTVCDCCNEYIYSDDTHTTEDEYVLCEYCYENQTSYCDCCGRVYYRDRYLHYHEPSEQYLCEDCLDNYEDDEIIKSYHTSKTKKDYNFLKCENEDITKYLTIGFENEIENIGPLYNEELVETCNIYDNSFIVSVENDGSLNNGFEIISQPFTKKYLIENQGKLENLFIKLVQNGARSHDTDTCGLHFHIGNLTEQGKTNVFHFFDKHYNEIYKLSRRKNNNYCSKNIFNLKSEKTKIRKKEITKKYKNQTSHSFALVNDDYTKTLEIRIFKGTLNFTTFLANFLFIYSLCEIANRSNAKITMKRILENIKDKQEKEILRNEYIKRGIL